MKSDFATYRKERNTKPISSADISVVVQGAISPLTKACLDSIRKNLPEAQIILSTWTESNINNLSYDKLVLSEDPGGVPLVHNDKKRLNNLNRQLVSTKNGLKEANRGYVLKIRSDLQLISNRFILEFEKYRAPAWHFRTKVLIVDYYTRNPYVVPVPFHPSDWMMFGEREDVKSYYDVPLMPKKDMLYYSSHLNRAKFFREALHRFTPEQWICLSFLKKKEPVICKEYFDASKENVDISIKMFRRDFIVIDSFANGIIFSKYNPNQSYEHFMLISHKDWLLLQKNFQLEKWVCMPRKVLFCFRSNISILLEKMGIKNFIHRIMNRKNGGKK